MWHNNRIRTYTLIFRGWYATVTLYCIVPFHGTDPRPTLSKSAVPPLDEKGIYVVQLRIELRPPALQADAQTTTPLHQSEAKGYPTLYLVSKALLIPLRSPPVTQTLSIPVYKTGAAIISACREYEHKVGIEPTVQSFADPCLSSWLFVHIV